MPRSLNRLLLVSLYALAAVMAWQLYERTYRDRHHLTVTVEAGDPDTLILAWRGAVEVPMARSLADAFTARGSGIRRVIVDLDSPGGSLTEGGTVIALIAEMRRSLDVDTRVRAGHDCLSMCVPIFLQGQRRLAAATSRWLFHEPRSVDYFSGKDVAEPQFEKKFYSERYLDRYFRASVVDPAWLARTEPLWQGADLWRNGRQLYDEKSNIVSELL